MRTHVILYLNTITGDRPNEMTLADTRRYAVSK